MKFKKGDRVNFKKRPKESCGTIVMIEPHLRYPVYVKWEDSSSDYCYYEHELELINEKIIDVEKLFEEIKL